MRITSVNGLRHPLKKTLACYFSESYNEAMENLSVTPAVWSKPDILRGTPVFSGTRVPFRILFDYLETGETIDAFLEEYPSVSRSQVIASLEQAKLAACHAHPA
jgi:uncharacterized protein (DUF433 family)